MGVGGTARWCKKGKKRENIVILWRPLLERFESTHLPIPHGLLPPLQLGNLINLEPIYPRFIPIRLERGTRRINPEVYSVDKTVEHIYSI